MSKPTAANRYSADDAYSAELRRLFGKAAGDARYDARGKSTPELRRLSDAKLAADAARMPVQTQAERDLGLQKIEADARVNLALDRASHAKDLADIASDKLNRLAEDMEAAATPGATLDGIPRTIADDRNEAAGSLERLVAVLPDGQEKLAATQQAHDLRADRLVDRPALIRRAAATWRVFADA